MTTSSNGLERELTAPLAEEELVSALLARPGLAGELLPILGSSDALTDPALRRIIRALSRLVHECRMTSPPTPLDQITLGALQSADPTIDAGLLTRLDERAYPSIIARAGDHARTIRRLANARQAQQIALSLARQALDAPDDLASHIGQTVELLAPLRSTEPVRARDKSLRAALAMPREEQAVGWPTGIAFFDHPSTMGGYKLGKVLLTLGREKGRKSTVLRFTAMAACVANATVAYYTYDGSWVDLKECLVAAQATAVMRDWDVARLMQQGYSQPEAIRQCPTHHWTLKPDSLHPGVLNDYQRQAVTEAEQRLAAIADRLYIYDQADGIGELSALEQAILDDIHIRGVHLFFIDYLQAIRVKGRKTETEELVTATARLDAIARTHNVTMVWVSQRSDENNRRWSEATTDPEKTPATTGAKGSNAPAAAADYILSVGYDQHRDAHRVHLNFWGGRYVGASRHSLFLNPESGLILNPASMPRPDPQ